CGTCSLPRPGRLGHVRCDGRFVLPIRAEADREGFDRILRCGSGKPHDGTGVDAAGEVAAHRHVGFQPQKYRVGEFLANGIDERCLVRHRYGCTPDREVDIPVALVVDLETSIAPPDLDEVAGLHLVYAAEGGGTRHDRLHQLVKQPLRIELPRDIRVCEQRFQLGPEYDALARLRPVERLDAEAVAYQEQGVFLFVIKCEGEL